MIAFGSGPSSLRLTDGASVQVTRDEKAFLAQFDTKDRAIAHDAPADFSPRQIGFIGFNPELDRAPLNVMSDRPLKGKPHPFRVVCFYTEDNEYAEHAERLRQTLVRFGIDHVLQPIRSIGDWNDNCAFKAEFIYEQWKRSAVPVVWLDADATVESHPRLFEIIDADVALHKWAWNHLEHDRGWEFCSGTVYFGKSERAEALLKQWIFRCKADPQTWDQVHLCSAWCDISCSQPLRTVWLPRPYLQIDGPPVLEPTVIYHWQASRQVRAKGKASLTPSTTEEGRRDRQMNRLWRSPEELFWINEGPQHIIPETGFQFPEGFDVGAALRTAVDGAFPMLEIGCGVGRIASLFAPDDYIGVDISPAVLAQARKALPNHTLRILDKGYAYPEAASALFYTVLLHVSDEEVQPLLARAVEGRQRLVIAELMDRRWRRPGDPPVFNRDQEDYILRLQQLGFRLTACAKHEYLRYAQEPWNVGRDSRITFLTFDRIPA